MERRERDRVNVRLQCRVDRLGQPSARQGGVTENISRTGMLIRWAKRRSGAPAVGDSVVIRLQTPRHPLYGQRWMLFRARVVRVNSDGKSLFVAVTGSRERFTAPAKPTLHAAPAGPYVN